MARSQGVFKTSIWDPGSEYRSLSPMGQWAYKMLVTQPQISNLGILPFTPEKWARLANGLTVAQVAAAIAELEAARYVVVDRDTFELLVRTFVVHDKVWSQPTLVTNARTLIRQVESDDIRALLSGRHPWLLTAAGRDEIEAFEDSYVAPIRPLSGGVSRGVSENPDRPQVKGAGVGVGDSSSFERQDLQTSRPPQDSAAAEPEPPRESEVRTAISAIKDSDSKSIDRVLPLAQRLPAALFTDVLRQHGERIRGGGVGNHTGLLIELLRLAERELCRRETVDDVDQVDLRSWLERDARSYARGAHPWEVCQPLMLGFLRKRGATGPFHDTLIEAARVAYDEVSITQVAA